jgi:hypothetical protein
METKESESLFFSNKNLIQNDTQRERERKPVIKMPSKAAIPLTVWYGCYCTARVDVGFYSIPRHHLFKRTI